MSRLFQDVRFAFRSLRKNPGFATVVILTLALGIGVTTAVFSIFYGVLLTPLPYPDPQELVLVYDIQPACKTCPASYPKFIDWKERNHVFSAIGGSTQSSFVMTGTGDPVQIAAMSTTASLGDVLGVHPQLGRWYSDAEDQPGGPRVVVLSHTLWTQRFNADTSILGRKLIFDGEPYEVIGVMPRGFSHRRGEAYIPLQRKLDPAARGSHFLTTYARMKKGMTLERAATEMRALGVTLASEFHHNHGIDVVSYSEAIVGGIRKPLNVLLGAVFFLLLIACANVANLLLSWGLARRGELAIRMALGAGPGALARQLATESVLLALAGGVLGMIFAQWTVETFVFLAGNQLPRANSIGTDSNVFGFAAIVSIFVGVFCSLWPIFLLCRRELALAVREGESRTGTGAGKKVGNGLVISEFALAFGLLVCAGLLVKNLVLLRSRDAGIRTDRIVAFDVAPAGPRYAAPESVLAFYRETFSRLSQIHGVESVGMTSHLPMYNFGWNSEFSVEGGDPWGPNEAPLVENRWMYGDYLKTLGVPLLSGRMLDQRDGKGTFTVLINRTTADKFWPGKDPLGRHFGNDSDKSKWFEVVGVIGNIRSFGLASNNPYEFYRTIEQDSFSAMTVVIRTSAADPVQIIPTARQIIGSLDAGLPLTHIQTLEQVVSDSVGTPRLMSALTGLFGGLAGMLAMVGVYSVLAYNVRRQRREFGIRLAIGASQADVKKLVVGRGLTLAVIGVFIGSIGAWLMTGLLKAMLNDVKPTDWTVFVATVFGVLAVALLASYLPARRAAQVDPMIALRYE